jgi:hypothetical protein
VRRVSFSALAALLLCYSAASSAKDGADYKNVLVLPSEHHVDVRLPLTDVTGKVRVKSRSANGLEQPVAPTHTRLDESDYLEWQIGYDTLNAQHPSLAPGIRYARKGIMKYGCELSKILAEARRLGIVSDEQLRRERDFLVTAREANLEDNARITVEERQRAEEKKLPGGFVSLVEEIPMFTKETAHGRIEIQLKPKQRAVGNQAMVYVCLNMRDVLNPGGTTRVPGSAHSKETVVYRFDRENVDFLFDIVRAFGIASRQHNEDLTNVLNCVLKLPKTES